MARYVVDPSMAMTWLFTDEKRADCDALQDELATTSEAIVPQHWSIEVANAILMGERRKRVSAAMVRMFVESIDALRVHEDHLARKNVFSDTLSIARAHNLTAYDAAYLELALRTGARLGSLDGSLRRAAKSMGVEVFPERL